MSRRLDAELVARGLSRSRTQAHRLVRAGFVSVDGQETRKPSQPVHAADRIAVAGDPRATDHWITEGWVGRGALKLQHALTTWKPAGLRAQGRRALDIGACTGGFTQALLRAGVSHVVALDVGHGQLAGEIANDPRVRDLPGTNIRNATAATIGGPVDLIVSDVSFISLHHVLPVLPGLAAPSADIVLLVKPQFEVGQDDLGRGGVVRSAAARQDALITLAQAAPKHGLAVTALERSPVTGASGNIEYLLWLRQCPPGMMNWAWTTAQVADRCAALRSEEES